MIFEGSGVVCICYPTFNTCACLPFFRQTRLYGLIRARMDDHYELEGDKVLHERKVT